MRKFKIRKPVKEEFCMVINTQYGMLDRLKLTVRRYPGGGDSRSLHCPNCGQYLGTGTIELYDPADRIEVNGPLSSGERIFYHGWNTKVCRYNGKRISGIWDCKEAMYRYEL